MALGHRIAARRSGAAMSREQLADSAGLSRRSIQRYGAATREPAYSALLLIASAPDASLAQIDEDA
ncbi:helix-turn-helix domain-containing protein [Streptomyces sp. NBC_01257]|nr:helix-turn-helix transcriptional regulator [Streptomyces sp. RTGN2]MCX5138761.1 helix-turn-helix domain-containing protein [Streptomyces sp. NBC_00338]WRZ69784.1 helix-turn-helix domain-containing protein [Streptomyces sp. NBC_01257]WSU63647.1 helix-turn-helix domain-containing protein [Streptomyces sp. NBC_01104]